MTKYLIQGLISIVRVNPIGNNPETYRSQWKYFYQWLLYLSILMIGILYFAISGIPLDSLWNIFKLIVIISVSIYTFSLVLSMERGTLRNPFLGAPPDVYVCQYQTSTQYCMS